MRAIPMVVRIADFVQVPLELGKVGLRERDAEVDEVICGSLADVDPVTRGRDTVFELMSGPSVCVRSGRDVEEAKEEHNKASG